MKRILVVCPTSTDKVHLKKFERDYELIFDGKDAAWNIEKFDVLKYIAKILKFYKNRKLDGVMSVEDYPNSIVANILAKELRLPHVDPKKILLCQHKYYSRKEQSQYVPEAVPKFSIVTNNNPRLKYPFFLKPVKSVFSMHANKIANENDFKAAIEDSHDHLTKFTIPFNKLIRKYTPLKYDGQYLIAEELLEGKQVTLEAFIYKNKFELIGITDSIMYPGTFCFQRFEYPSKLNKNIKNRMVQIAERLMDGIKLNNGIFNIEMFYNEKSGKISIIEINPRMCAQFADLMGKVNGTNTYEIQLSLVTGQKPSAKRFHGKYNIAASFVLRMFEDKKVTKVPTKKQIMELTKKFPDCLLFIFCWKKGVKLSEVFGKSKSYVYARINLGAKSKKDLFKKFEYCKKHLTFEFE